MTWASPLLALAKVALVGGRPPIEDPLESSVRRKILRIVRATPGITMMALASRADVPAGSIRHHLKHLAKAGLIRVEEARDDSRARRIYPLDARRETPAPPPLHPVLQGAPSRVAEIIAAHPGISFSELVDRSGRAPRTVHTHLKALTEAGFVTSDSPAHYRSLRPTAILLDALGEPSAERQ